MSEKTIPLEFYVKKYLAAKQRPVLRAQPELISIVVHYIACVSVQLLRGTKKLTRAR